MCVCVCVQDTAGAVPFVPGTPGGSSMGQGPSAGTQPPALPSMTNLRSTPFDWGPPAGTALGSVQGEASRGSDGQAVGSSPLHPRRGDDSAKAGPSQSASLPLSPPAPPPPPPPSLPSHFGEHCSVTQYQCRSHSACCQWLWRFTLYICFRCKNHMTGDINKS